MEKFIEELKREGGPHGEKAWAITEEWYTRDGRARRLSLHDLHELSKSIKQALLESESALRAENAKREQYLEAINSLMWSTWGIVGRKFGHEEGERIMEILERWAEGKSSQAPKAKGESGEDSLRSALEALIVEFEAEDPMPDAPNYSIHGIAKAIRRRHVDRLRVLLLRKPAEVEARAKECIRPSARNTTC